MWSVINSFERHKRNDEITLYCALQLADWMDEKELWLDVYKYGLSKKITPRDSLQEEYKERQKRDANVDMSPNK